MGAGEWLCDLTGCGSCQRATWPCVQTPPTSRHTPQRTPQQARRPRPHWTGLCFAGAEAWARLWEDTVIMIMIFAHRSQRFSSSPREVFYVPQTQMPWHGMRQSQDLVPLTHLEKGNDIECSRNHHHQRAAFWAEVGGSYFRAEDIESPRIDKGASPRQEWHFYHGQKEPQQPSIGRNSKGRTLCLGQRRTSGGAAELWLSPAPALPQGQRAS